MRKLRRILLIFLGILFVSVASSVNIFAANDPTYSFNADTTYTTYEHLMRKEMKGELKVKAYTNNVVVNILDFNLKEDNLHMVPISLYEDYAWGMNKLSDMAKAYEEQNPHLEVVAAINGDFYDINNTGRSLNVHIENYKIIKGTPNGNPILIFREDGTTEIGHTRAEGHEVIVFNEFDEIKFRQKIDFINNVAITNEKVGLFLNDTLPVDFSNLDAFKVNSNDIKYEGANLQIAEGLAMSNPVDSTVGETEFVLTGEAINNIISEGDRILVQVKLAGFEDVRGAVGGHGTILVRDGVVPNNIEDCGFFCRGQRAPRTAVGIREDGSVFWVVSNGRDEEDGVPGLQMLELAELMLSQGAYQAINLDGGGSSTMIVKDLDGELIFANKLSDPGNVERSISNGVLLVRGDIDKKPINIQGISERASLDAPQNLQMNVNNLVKFDPVDNAVSYYLEINGIKHEISSNTYDLSHLRFGEYKIRVLAKGTNTHQTSIASDELTFRVKYPATNEVLEWIKTYAKNNN